MTEPVSRSTQLAEHLAAFRLRDVPPEAVVHAKLILLDTLGAMLAASSRRFSATRILLDFVRRLGGRPESSLVGQRLKTSCVNAALFNGTLAYYCDIEPHHVGGILHAPAVMVPTSLAVAEKERATGTRFLEAMVLGIEVTCRVSYALNPVALYNRGFHPSAICGAFGAAAAAGHLFRLSACPSSPTSCIPVAPSSTRGWTRCWTWPTSTSSRPKRSRRSSCGSPPRAPT